MVTLMLPSMLINSLITLTIIVYNLYKWLRCNKCTSFHEVLWFCRGAGDTLGSASLISLFFSQKVYLPHIFTISMQPE